MAFKEREKMVRGKGRNLYHITPIRNLSHSYTPSPKGEIPDETVFG